MNFSDWTYKRKNTALLIGTVLFLILAWFLAFGKTFRLISDYYDLSAKLDINRTENFNAELMSRKRNLQDSLLQMYSADSLSWTSSVLTGVGELILEQSIGVSFENKAIETNNSTVEREVTLIGPFKELQSALSAIENGFYIKSLKSYLDKDELKYNLRLVIVKN